MLLVALTATATMNTLALMDNSAVQALGVQGATASADQLVALAQDIAELPGSFDTNSDKLARSSAIRNLTTALGDTTLNGIGSSANFATLFPVDASVAEHMLKLSLKADATTAEQDKAARVLAKIANNASAGRGKTVLMSAASGDAEVADFLNELADLDPSILNAVTTTPIEFGGFYSALDYARHTGNISAEAALSAKGATSNVHNSLQSFGPINK